MKRIIVLLVGIITLSMMMTACKKHDEITFEGIVVGVRTCDLSYTDRNVGYLVHVTTPDSIGGTIRNESDSVTNVVVLYEPAIHIMVEDKIAGSFYLQKGYSKANCSVSSNDFDLPEGVFVDLTRK